MCMCTSRKYFIKFYSIFRLTERVKVNAVHNCLLKEQACPDNSHCKQVGAAEYKCICDYPHIMVGWQCILSKTVNRQGQGQLNSCSMGGKACPDKSHCRQVGAAEYTCVCDEPLIMVDRKCILDTVNVIVASDENDHRLEG